MLVSKYSVAALFVGGQGGLVLVDPVTVTVRLPNLDIDAGQRRTVQAGDTAADIHALAGIAGLPQIDQFRFFVCAG
jgi:hypothetical protein